MINSPIQTRIYTPCIHSLRTQRGSFLTEFVIVAGFVLVPMAIMFPVVFKYTENNQYLNQAARYSVWERTAYYQDKPRNKPDNTPVKSELQIAREVQNRVLLTRMSR